MQKITKYLKFSSVDWLAQRHLRYFPVRNQISNAVAALKPKPVDYADYEEAQSGARTLEDEGILFFRNYLDQERLTTIKNALAPHTLQERYPPFREGFLPEAPPEGVHVGDYSHDVLLNIPEILEIANDPRLLAIVGQTLGCKPTISNLSVWWSFPTDGSAQEAENYHRDVIDWRFIKFFVYLTDVDSQSGPHRFVKKSHVSTQLRALKRFTDEEVAESFPAEDCLEITGKAGDAFLENTFGIHKGQPPLDAPRLLLQIQYSINPTSVYTYSPKDIGPHGYDPYSNRLFLQ
jgi:hypothetical protein